MGELIQCKGGCDAWTEGWTCKSCGRAKPGNSPRAHGGAPPKKMGFFAEIFAPMPASAAATPVLATAKAKPSCPRCGAAEMSAVKKGFGFGKAAAGALIAGPIGLAAGGIGSGTVKLACHTCGHQWRPGRG